jgi:DNA-binding XRE family transcriptional regulator
MTETIISQGLRASRRRTGLSQLELAFLIGGSDANVSRHERHENLPDLETGFAYETILRIPARELFARDAQAIEEGIRSRAIQLYGRLARGRQSRQTEQKLEVLRHLTR